jgi:hypothetical protein
MTHSDKRCNRVKWKWWCDLPRQKVTATLTDEVADGSVCVVAKVKGEAHGSVAKTRQDEERDSNKR